MLQPLQVSVAETVAELRSYQKRHPSKFKALQMLIIIKQQGSLSQDKLATLLGSGPASVLKWRRKYITGGLEALLVENRGGHKKAKITPQVESQLAQRLHDPKGGFRSFIEIQQWLLTEFNIEMGYHAVNKHVKRKYGGRLKVSRKSHVLKSPAAEAVFKKPV
ncbi:MAG TPA: helix-turn-helix domain-containing protein [Flavisolibacter sp.]|jgi:transposase